ncbi:hypothetical protein LMJF_29_1680 [Leishmania major strain Friedlin]|uniref:Uncharacterized protein n=1 Tax=Leishmania major TaxID=5664 RepID=E9AE29_LEIMA|nr:hypothetical protein LMJF_29_1680 [Leishmania major strain Friedlin]CBZ12508.1 hypothetical protein LMJF_29_1680 [Leishmania major strain Friedlin]|eukprot:XP_003722250.1 hypothetical protein LMJF_29_1680 [Leishmania major strain Friedlin]
MCVWERSRLLPLVVLCYCVALSCTRALVCLQRSVSVGSFLVCLPLLDLLVGCSTAELQLRVCVRFRRAYQWSAGNSTKHTHTSASSPSPPLLSFSDAQLFGACHFEAFMLAYLH